MPTFDGNLNEITFSPANPLDYADTYYTYTKQSPLFWSTNTNTDASYTFDTTTYVTKDDLNKYFKRIYEIINEHVAIDISEEDFVNIIMEG